jgi:hypothetical protein
LGQAWCGKISAGADQWGTMQGLIFGAYIFFYLGLLVHLLRQPD